MKKRWICLFVENEIGVLARISGLFSNVNNLTQATTTYCIFTFNWHGVPCAFLHSRSLTQLKYCTNFSSKNQQIYY